MYYIYIYIFFILYIYIYYMGVSWNGGTPIAGWFILKNAIYKWMIWVVPLFQETSIYFPYDRRARASKASTGDVLPTVEHFCACPP